MTSNDDLERRVADFYANEAPQRAPDRVLERALATIDTTRQRRELSLAPWRSFTMNVYAKLAVTAVAVMAVGAIGLMLLGPGSGPAVGGPGSSASPTPSTSPARSSSAAPSPPPLTETYTSAVHGLSISYPSGWRTVPATDPESTAEPGFLSPADDFLHHPSLEDHLFLALGSDSLDGQPGETWATGVFAADDESCAVPEPITVDGAPGLRCGHLVLTWADDRGYSIRLYTSGDEAWLDDVYDDAWFDEVLTTVQLPATS